MKLDDRLVGAVLIAVGALIYGRAQSFPLMAGLPYGPGLFPSIAAVGMMLCGAVIALTGQLARSDGGRDQRGAAEAGSDAAPPAPGAGAGWAPAGRMAGIVAIVVAVGLALDPLGFHVAAAAAVAAAAMIFGRGAVTAVLLGVVAAVLAHAVFYSVLRVPLPWGLLEPVAW